MSDSAMILLNFTHPLTDAQLAQIEELTGNAIERLVETMVQLDEQAEFSQQVTALADEVGLEPRDWQTLPILVNPPGHAPGAVALLAELHGRMGYFPAIVRLRPVQGSNPRRYEIAEIMNLQEIRDSARKLR